MNIFNFDQIFRETMIEAGVTAQSVALLLDPVPPKTLRVLTHVTIEDETTAFTKVRLGILNAGVTFYVDELKAVLANELCVSRSDILLGEGDRFFAQLTGTTTGDLIKMVAIGWDGKI